MVSPAPLAEPDAGCFLAALEEITPRTSSARDELAAAIAAGARNCIWDGARCGAPERS